MSKKNRDGEWIHLDWDSCDPEFLIVRGHVDIETFEKVAEGVDPEEYNCDCYQQPRHTYAIWLMHGPQSAEDGFRCLELRNSPGRGRFKVTVSDRILHHACSCPYPKVGDRRREAGIDSWGTVKAVHEGTGGSFRIYDLVHLDMDDGRTSVAAKVYELRADEMPKWGPIDPVV